MNTEKPYNRSHGEALLRPTFKHGESSWRIDEKGVWPAIEFEESDRLGIVPEYEVLSWKPVMVLRGDQPAPDWKNTPALPFPFGARDLAAFMLGGVGGFVAGYYGGDWEGGPNEDAIDGIDPGDNYARQAVREAFAACRDAKKAIGCPAGEWPDTGSMVLELLKPTQPALAIGTPPKLLDVQRTEVLRLYDGGRGMSVRALANQFDVSRRTIDAVLGKAGVKKVTPR